MGEGLQHLRARFFLRHVTAPFYVEVCRRMLRSAALLAKKGDKNHQMSATVPAHTAVVVGEGGGLKKRGKTAAAND